MHDFSFGLSFRSAPHDEVAVWPASLVNLVQQLLMLLATRRRVDLVLEHERQVPLDALGLLAGQSALFAAKLEETLEPETEIT
jgi:hypothetical protein